MTQRLTPDLATRGRRTAESLRIKGAGIRAKAITFAAAPTAREPGASHREADPPARGCARRSRWPRTAIRRARAVTSRIEPSARGGWARVRGGRRHDAGGRSAAPRHDRGRAPSTKSKLRGEFGAEVAAIVAECTDSAAWRHARAQSPWGERKRRTSRSSACRLAALTLVRSVRQAPQPAHARSPTCAARAPTTLERFTASPEQTALVLRVGARAAARRVAGWRSAASSTR
jgi:hypothetical protein